MLNNKVAENALYNIIIDGFIYLFIIIIISRLDIILHQLGHVHNIGFGQNQKIIMLIWIFGWAIRMSPNIKTFLKWKDVTTYLTDEDV